MQKRVMRITRFSMKRTCFIRGDAEGAANTNQENRHGVSHREVIQVRIQSKRLTQIEKMGKVLATGR